MLKKIIKIVCLILFMFISSGLFSACCGPKKLEVNIIFKNADSRLGLESYVENIRMSDDVEVEFVIPEGYDASKLSTAMVNNTPKELEVVLDNPNVEEGFEYTVSKTVTLKVKRVLQGIDIVFDMAEVQKRKFALTLDQNLLSMSVTSDNKTNFTLVRIDPEKLDNLVRLDNSTVIGMEDFPKDRFVHTSTVYVEYGEYVAVSYNRRDGKADLGTLYSDIGDFTPTKYHKFLSGLSYAQYDVARRGNSYYNLFQDNALNIRSRVFYIGRIQESINLYKSIPGYKSQVGFDLEKSKNTFTILSNKQDYNSDLLDIAVYKAIKNPYNPGVLTRDKVGNQTIELMEKYDENGALKNDNLVYEYLNRYDAYNMYVGENLDTDTLLSQEEKFGLSTELYVRIRSEIPLDKFNVRLLTREKQSLTAHHNVLLTAEESVSERGYKYYKIDREAIEGFLVDRTTYQNNQVFNYKIGYSILYFQLDPNYIETSLSKRTFEYSAINYPVFYGTGNQKIDYDYKIEFYVLNEDNSKDYGLLDLHGLAEDIVYFRTDKLFDNNDNYLNTLHINVIGPKYNDFYEPMIERVYLNCNGQSLVSAGIIVSNSMVFNGIQDYQIPYRKEPAMLDQYKISINLDLQENREYPLPVDFSNLEIGNYTDAIYVSNKINFTTDKDFIRIDELSKGKNSGITISNSSDIYYLVVGGRDFDLYVGEWDEEEDVEVAVKDNLRKITASKKLYDITGDPITVYVNNLIYEVYVKYLVVDVYGTNVSRYFAFSS